MTPDEAGAALAADPTFATMTAAERESEAAALLGGFATPSDDPLDIALAVEIAEAVTAKAEVNARAWQDVARGMAVELGVIEPCRLNGADGPDCSGNEPIAGNGRCMTCGAQRAVQPQIAARQPAMPEKAPAAGKSRRTAAEWIAEGATFLRRYKEAVNASDRYSAELLGVSRPTVQAYIGGRLAEKLTDAQALALIADIEGRSEALADLRRDIMAAIGAID